MFSTWNERDLSHVHSATSIGIACEGYVESNVHEGCILSSRRNFVFHYIISRIILSSTVFKFASLCVYQIRHLSSAWEQVN